MESKNEHAVHSPFVFNLLTKCFYDTKSKPEYALLKQYRNSLLQNKNTIEVTDFGAGSRVFKSNKREVAQIAKTAGITPKRAELLFRIVNYFQPDTLFRNWHFLRISHFCPILRIRMSGRKQKSQH